MMTAANLSGIAAVAASLGVTVTLEPECFVFTMSRLHYAKQRRVPYIVVAQARYPVDVARIEMDTLVGEMRA